LLRSQRRRHPRSKLKRRRLKAKPLRKREKRRSIIITNILKVRPREREKAKMHSRRG
jgi:hypothetical protein